MSRPEPSRGDSFQYPATHTGHLSEGQQSALDKFKTIAQQSGYYKPANPPAQPYPSHDNETMLRYLRARKFMPDDALKQFKETEDWRKSTHIDELYDNIDLDEYEDARKLYPQWLGRVDKRGVPVYVYEVANLTSKAISAYENSKPKYPTVAHNTKNVPPKLITLFALYENLIQMVLPFCSLLPRPHLETPMSQSSNIVDISNVGLKTFWNLKSHMQDASQLATAHYPETLDRIFIIGAPSFFPTVWSWIKRWFDPITVSKIFILAPNQVKSTLEQYMDIADIPVKYGGNLKWTFPNHPILESKMEAALHWVEKQGQTKEQSQKAFASGPIRWQVGESGKMEAVAVGSINGRPRRMVVATTDATWETMFGGASPSSVGGRNEPVNWNLERVESTTGHHTHPTEDGDPNYGASLKSTDSGSNTPVRGNSIAESDTTLVNSGIGYAYANRSHDLPAKPDPNTTAPGLSPMNSQPRQGTSESRLEQQRDTHAHGNPALTNNSPHVIDYGNGEKAAVVEPLTVGQAPKDVSAHIPEPEQPQETYIEQAQHVAHDVAVQAQQLGTQAVSSVMAIVGGKKVEEVQQKQQERPPMAHNDTTTTMGSVDDRSVEEMLRDQYSSKHTGAQQRVD